jgi:WKF domain
MDSAKPHRNPEGKQERKRIRKAELANKPTLLTSKAVEYLKLWMNHKSEWKFSKSTQNYIIRRMYERKIFKKSLFKSTILEYLKSIQGNLKKVLREEAEKLSDEKVYGENVNKLNQQIEQIKKELTELSDEKESKKKMMNKAKVKGLQKEMKQLRTTLKRASIVAKALSN